MSSRDEVASQACEAQKKSACKIKQQPPYTQIVFILALVIVGAVLLVFYWKKVKAIGIWLPIVLISVLFIMLIVALIGFIPHCLLRADGTRG